MGMRMASRWNERRGGNAAGGKRGKADPEANAVDGQHRRAQALQQRHHHARARQTLNPFVFSNRPPDRQRKCALGKAYNRVAQPATWAPMRNLRISRARRDDRIPQQKFICRTQFSVTISRARHSKVAYHRFCGMDPSPILPSHNPRSSSAQPPSEVKKHEEPIQCNAPDCCARRSDRRNHRCGSCARPRNGANHGQGRQGRSSLQQPATDTAKHSCKGKNDCKGQGGCKSSDNGCKGKNSCKGKGGCATDGSKMPELV